MIDPLQPGPAGSQGPAGVEITGPTPQQVAGMLQSGAAAVSSATGTLLSVASVPLQSAVATLQSSIGQLAGAVVPSIDAAQTTLQLAGTQLMTTAASMLPALPPPVGSVPPVGASGPNFTTGWNLWSVRDDNGWGPPIAEQYFTTYRDGCQYLFRGWAPDLGTAEAIAATLGRLGKDVRPECFTYGPDGPTCDITVSNPVYHIWQRVNADGSATCVSLCSSLPGPTGFKDLGVDPSPGAQGPIGVFFSCVPPPPPPKDCTNSVCYYGGCVSGKSVTWDSTQAVPQGVTGIVGPFLDQASASAAIGTCPPIITPPNVGTGQCCGIDPTTGALILPDCIKIDLCKWDEFCRELSLAVRQALNAVLCDPTCFVQPLCDCLEKSLCKVFSNKECTAGYQDAERYIFEDQDNTFSPDIQAWTGDLGSTLYNAQSLDEMAASAFGGG